MLKGTRIHGVDVSNMTKEQAKQAVESTLEASGAEVKLTLLQENGVMPSAAPADEADAPADTGDGEEEEAPILYTKTDKGVVYTPTARNLILTADVDKAVQEAFDLARDSQDYEGTMALVNNIAQNGKDIALSYTASPESVQAYVEDISFLIDKPAVNKAYNVDPDTHKLSVTECEDGYGIDREALEKAFWSWIPPGKRNWSSPCRCFRAVTPPRNMCSGGNTKPASRAPLPTASIISKGKRAYQRHHPQARRGVFHQRQAGAAHQEKRLEAGSRLCKRRP